MSPQDKSGKYLSKKEKGIIKEYLQKRYDEKILRLIQKEIYELEHMLSKASTITDDIKNIYSNSHDEIKSYVEPIDISDKDYIKGWMSTQYNGKPLNPNIPFYKTDRGELVRSKSELNIANFLNKRNIPYKYECPLELKHNIIIYPDFTVLNVEKRKEIYWEHRGMMDDREYVKHSVLRLKNYADSGFFLGDNLIISEESSNLPLGTDYIENIINHYFR